MSIAISDGEPYEVNQIRELVDLNLFIREKTAKEVVSSDLNESFFVSGQLDRKFQEEFGKFVNSGLTTDLRLKSCCFLFAAFDGFSCEFIQNIGWKCFLMFSKDDYFYIRKVCAANVCKFVKTLQCKYHKAVIENFQRFIVDKNVLVVQAAYSSLGLMSYLLFEIDDRVIHWIEMLSCSDLAQAAELAFYLPAIYRKFPNHRQSILKVLRSLLSNPQSQVRSKAASTLSFFIKNTENPATTFLSIYQNLLKDTDIVKVEAISHLGTFLERVPESHQSSFIGTFRRIQTYRLNWRVNLKLAKSLNKIARNLKVELWMQELWQVSLALCKDSNDVVRIRSAKSLGKMIKDLWNLKEEWDSVIRLEMENLSLSQSFRDRVVLVHLAGVCCRIQWFAELLEKMLRDKVVDVRIGLAVVANEYGISWLRAKLLEDSSKIVQSIASTPGKILKSKKLSIKTLEPIVINDSDFNEVYTSEGWFESQMTS